LIIHLEIGMYLHCHTRTMSETHRLDYTKF
jgi:hypothetical protein